ncbi:DUF2189 domain-containing protein [Paraferrimonas sp. SM1919]|uniref:DUF2189 domain-containing protein n=1 Tax=Paraferrimonas sp. SM1919 TaxID=2662263 RepID=UPI0013D52E40|nr:DUF2189 domain-containing protein [Paraferrimonas sp. SM1919]
MPKVIDSGVVKPTNKDFARTIESTKLDINAPFHWLELAWQDFLRAPGLSLLFGACFAVATFAIMYFVYLQSSHLVILPSLVLFVLAGPFLASCLYSISWDLARDKQPTLQHALFAISRNKTSKWGFAVFLAVTMILWMRIAALLHVFYPSETGAPIFEFLPFLLIGSLFGLVLMTFVFMVSAFSMPLMMERRVDLMTAIISSFKAVKANKKAMIIWALMIVIGVLVGILTAGIAMMVIMPLLGYATWHGYLETITTKQPRHYE